MLYLLAKAVISAVIVVIVSEVSKRYPALGALIVSLPLVSVLGMIWLWRDTGDPARMAAHAQATFWYVLPTLPMFLLIAAMVRHGAPFWGALAAGIALTLVLYGIMIWALGRWGVSL